MHIQPERIPILSGLPRLELVRLLPELELIALEPEEDLPQMAADRVFIICSGQVEWLTMDAEESIPIHQLSVGDIIIPGDPAIASPVLYRCLTTCELVSLPAARWQALLEKHPGLAHTVHRLMEDQLDQTRSSLGRTRRLLEMYARELWGHIPEHELASAALLSSDASVEAPQPMPPAERTAPAAQHHHQQQPPWWRHQLVGWGTALLVAAGAVIWGPPREHAAFFLIGIMLWAGINWALATLPDHVVALGATMGCVVLGFSTLEVAFGGFASESWWILVAVLGLVVTVTRSGLLYRLALWMLQRLPPTYWWQAIALTLTGLVMTPCVPNVNARVSILGPLVAELSDAMRLGHNSRGSAGLAMATYLGGSQAYFLFLNGAPMTLLVWSILPAEAKAHVTWWSWFMAAAPMAAVLIIGFLAVLFVMYRPGSAKAVSRATVALQQSVLGPMNKQEWLSVGVLTILLLGFITQSWHGLSPAWFAVGGFIILMGSGLLDREGLRQIDWTLIFYMGAVISLTAIAQKAGLQQLLTTYFAPWVQRLHLSATLFLVAAAILTIVMRLAVPGPVVTVVLTVALQPVAQALGISALILGLVVAAFCSSWLVPQQWSVYLNLSTATGDRCFTHKQVQPLAWVNNLLLLTGLLVSVPLWRLMGLLQ